VKHPRVLITKDRVSKVVGAINRLVGEQVLIGIPENTTSRENEEGAPITNAALGYIHEFGAPGANIPARPFLVPGVRKAQRDVMPHLRAACAAALDGDRGKIPRELIAAGLIAEASAKREITTADFVPLKPATVRGRARKRGAKKMRAAETEYLRLIASGVSPAGAQAAAGIRPLIDTGALRASLTHVVRSTRK
jgi:hypothetical protein